MSVTVPIELLIQIVGMVGGFGVLWGVIRSEIRSLREWADKLQRDVDKFSDEGFLQRVRELERHTPKVEQIPPLSERMGALERRFETEFERFRQELHLIGSSMRELAAAVMARKAG